MKKLFILLTLLLTVSACFGQNTGINISFLHSAEGKAWKRFNNPDGNSIHPSELEALYIFKSDGSFIYKETGNSTAREISGTSKRWSYNETNNVLSWDITMANGLIKKYRAELTYIDQERMVTNLSENGEEPIIAVYIIN